VEIKFLENDKTFMSGFKSILESVTLIKYADAVINPMHSGREKELYVRFTATISLQFDKIRTP
jgi:hypothetical protein